MFHVKRSRGQKAKKNACIFSFADRWVLDYGFAIVQTCDSECRRTYSYVFIWYPQSVGL